MWHMAEHSVRDHHGILTTVEMLEYSASAQPDSVALRIFRRGSYEEISYREFLGRVNKFAAGLIERGTRPGDKVSILGENRPEWAIAYLGIHRAGATCVPLDSLLKAPEFRHIIVDSGAVGIVVSDRFIVDILEIRDGLDRDLAIMAMDDDTHDDPAVLRMSDMLESSLPGQWPELTLDNLAALIYTSGTTGQSKGVMLSQRNICSDTALSFQCIEYGPDDNFLSVLPLHHTFECTGGFLIPMYGGSTITYARSLKSRDIVDDIRNTAATVMLGVPLLFEKMMQGIQRKLSQAPPTKKALISVLFSIESAGSKVNLELGGVLFKSLREKAGMLSLRMLISGGAALPPHVSEWFGSLGFPILQGYGLTETSPVINVGRPGILSSNSVGPPIPGVEQRIENPSETGEGEVSVRGPMVMLGYLNNDQATREVIDEDGWFHTGDIGYVDDMGRLCISGRMKNVIVTPAGKNVYPEEVEHYINQCPSILESLVLGRAISGTTSEEVHAIVVPDYEYLDEQGTLRGAQYTTEEIESLVRSEVKQSISNMPDYKRPKQFEIREDEFEKTSTKKIKRFLHKQRDIPVTS
jgi:long-chain acyl-CoA synthetase